MTLPMRKPPSAPTVLAMLSQSVVNEIDVIYFSHLPCPESSNGQAALLPSLILTWLFGGSLSAISVDWNSGTDDQSGIAQVRVDPLDLNTVRSPDGFGLVLEDRQDRRGGYSGSPPPEHGRSCP